MKFLPVILLLSWAVAAMAAEPDPELRDVLRAAASESPSFACLLYTSDAADEYQRV